MKRRIKRQKGSTCSQLRKGAIAVLAAFLMIPVLAFDAVTADIRYLPFITSKIIAPDEINLESVASDGNSDGNNDNGQGSFTRIMLVKQSATAPHKLPHLACVCPLPADVLSAVFFL